MLCHLACGILAGVLLCTAHANAQCAYVKPGTTLEAILPGGMDGSKIAGIEAFEAVIGESVKGVDGNPAIPENSSVIMYGRVLPSRRIRLDLTQLITSRGIFQFDVLSALITRVRAAGVETSGGILWMPKPFLGIFHRSVRLPKGTAIEIKVNSLLKMWC